MTTNTTRPTVLEVAKTLQRFGWIDLIIFMGMLLGCSMIGVYFAILDKKKSVHKTNRSESLELDYLVGGRNMKVFPIAMSLVASWISGISLLGSSTEIYIHGSEIMFIFIAMILTGLSLHFVFLPVYSEMKITSIYEYLEKRFDQRVRNFGSIIFFVDTVSNF